MEPMIRDMTKRCKCCGCYGFADDFTKDGLCYPCARGEVPVKPRDSEIDKDWGNW